MENLRTKLFVAAATFGAIAGFAGVAGAATPDPITGTGGAIESIQTKLIGYAGPVVVALVAIGLAWVAVKIAPRIMRIVSSRLG